MRGPKLIDKKLKKLVDRKCRFCPVSDYNLLDVHRIIEGANGGVYSEINTVTLCSNCHRKVHSKEIVILGKHFSTAGYLVHYLENNIEKWV